MAIYGIVVFAVTIGHLDLIFLTIVLHIAFISIILIFVYRIMEIAGMVSPSAA